MKDIPNFRNNLLSMMPAQAAEQVMRVATPVQLPQRTMLQSPDRDIAYCYFLEDGLVSILARLNDGEPLETGLIGKEGFVGAAAVLGVRRSPAEALVQIEGSALRVEADALKALFDSDPEIRAPLLLHMHAMQVQVAQTAACNGRHEVEQRLARWLLTAGDKYDNRPMPFTQEFLSMMLGVRRQQVSLTAGGLMRKRYIHYSHGRIEITNREGLQKVACECYEVVAREFESVLGAGPAQPL